MFYTTRRGVTTRTAGRSGLGAAAADTIAQQLGNKPTHSKAAPSKAALVPVGYFEDLSDASTTADNNTKALAVRTSPAAVPQLVWSEEHYKTLEAIANSAGKTMALRASLRGCSSVTTNKPIKVEPKQAQPQKQAEPAQHQEPKEQERECIAWVSQVLPMTAEEERGWRQVEAMITSSPSHDNTTTQPETQESVRDQPTPPVPAAAAPLLPETLEELSPQAQPTQHDKALIESSPAAHPTQQDKALSGKQAQEKEESKTVEIKLLHLTLATSPAGSLIVILTPATNNTFSTTDAGEATEETNTAVPVLPEPFQPVKSCVCADAGSLTKPHKSGSKALTSNLTMKLKRGLSAAASCVRKVATLPKLPKRPKETHQARSSEEESEGRPVPKARSWVRRLLKGSALVAAVRAAVRS